MSVLDEELHLRITALSEKGDRLLNAGDCGGALKLYHQAWALLPEPRDDWEAATWLLSAIGDAHFIAGDFRDAIAAFSKALLCPDGLGNPFIHLRLGEACFEIGDMHRARDELTRAYMGGGSELFENEDRKYFSLLRATLQPPLGDAAD